MSTLQVTNIHLESTGNNRIQYSGSNTITIAAGGANVAVINSTSFNILTGNTSLTEPATFSNTITVTGNATFSNTVAVTGDLTLGGAVDETVYAISGTTPTLDPSNGTIQTHTLTGNTTYTDGLAEGESITLMIDDGTDYTITWPTMTWKTDGGVAPTLNTSGFTVIQLWKVGSTLYGARVGDA